jgi:arylformamidase
VNNASGFDWRTAPPDEVDFQYSPSRHAQRPLDEYLAEYHALSAGHDPALLTLPHRPLLIYIHGGYWQRLSAADSLFNAPDAIAENVSLHAVDYTLAPAASIPEIIAECIDDVVSTIESLEPTKVVLTGCSAGAHLVAMCMREEQIASRVDAAVMLSGIYDLRPLVVTPTNDPLRLTVDSAEEVSPQLLSAAAPAKRALLAVGRHESSEFIRQNEAYASLLAARGSLVDVMVVEGRDHFDLPYDLLRRGTRVGDWVLHELSGGFT